MNKTQKLLFCLAGALVIIALLAFVFSRLANRFVVKSDDPSVGLLTLSGETLIIEPRTGFPESAVDEIKAEQFVFCLQTSENVEDCDWQNYDDFMLVEETTYYAFVKSLSTEKVSAPKSFTYEKIDFSKLRL